MYGIKLNTTDIDIGCTENFFRELQSNGYSVIKKMVIQIEYKLMIL